MLKISSGVTGQTLTHPVETWTRGLMHVLRTTENIFSMFCKQQFLLHIQWDIKYNIFYLGTVSNGLL